MSTLHSRSTSDSKRGLGPGDADARGSSVDLEDDPSMLDSDDVCESSTLEIDASTADGDRKASSDEDPATATAGAESEKSPEKLRGWPRFEAWIERLAHKYSFIRKITSRLYLPIAFHSGLTMKKLDPKTFSYVLPFRRFNRNFYDAMAGAALVANSEIAAGMFLFGELGGNWTIVCKNINYRFLRPCLGPAIYNVDPLEDVTQLMASGKEFNIDLELEIQQQVSGRNSHPRVGRCEVTFHCAPKGPHGNRGFRRRRRRRPQ